MVALGFCWSSRWGSALKNPNGFSFHLCITDLGHLYGGLALLLLFLLSFWDVKVSSNERYIWVLWLQVIGTLFRWVVETCLACKLCYFGSLAPALCMQRWVQRVTLFICHPCWKLCWTLLQMDLVKKKKSTLACQLQQQFTGQWMFLAILFRPLKNLEAKRVLSYFLAQNLKWSSNFKPHSGCNMDCTSRSWNLIWETMLDLEAWFTVQVRKCRPIVLYINRI